MLNHPTAPPFITKKTRESQHEKIQKIPKLPSQPSHQHFFFLLVCSPSPVTHRFCTMVKPYESWLPSKSSEPLISTCFFFGWFLTRPGKHIQKTNWKDPAFQKAGKISTQFRAMASSSLSMYDPRPGNHPYIPI